MRNSVPPVLALAALLALALPPTVHAQYNWVPSGLGGSGTSNCLAIQPGGTGVIVSAQDVSGFLRSTDYGQHWLACNLGVSPISKAPKVATVVFSNNPSTPNTVYAGTGNEGESGTGGFLVSADAGQTWTLKSSAPIFSGNGETGITGLPDRWPRSTGNLIAVDETGTTKYLYAGTFDSGMMRSTDGGATWATVGLSGKYIRSIAMDPSKPSNLYVAAYGGKIWEITTARTTTGTGTSGWTQLTNAPDEVEEMIVLSDGNIYAAGTSTTTSGGVWKSTTSTTGTWTKLATSSISSSSTWTAIAGYVSGANDVLYIGATNPVQQSGDANYRTILKSTNSGSTWTAITLAANIVNQIGGAGGPVWWMGLSSGNPGYLLGHNACDLANIQVDPSSLGHVLVGGRGGVWATTNATAADTSILWYPMVDGLMVAAAKWAAVDPNNSGRVYIADEDHVFFWSTDWGATFQCNNPGGGSGGTSHSIYVDPTDSTVYLGTLSDSSAVGNVYSSADPTTGSWTDEGLSAVDGNKQVCGVISGRDSGNNRLILAAVESSGLWRKSGSTWTQVSTAIKPGDNLTMTFSWKKGSAYVFAYEESTGLWRSNSYGASGSWTNIWSVTSSATDSGFVVGDPTTDGTLYVSTDSGVFRFVGATSGTPTPTAMGGPANPGPIALGNGALFVCNLISPSQNGQLYKWSNPATSTTSAAISDTVDYPGQCNWPSGLAVDSPSGIVYVSNNGNSTMLGATTVLFSDNFEEGNADNWTVLTGTWAVVSDGTEVYQESGTGGGISQAGSTAWTDYSVEADLKALSLGTGSIGLGLRVVDVNDRYYALFNAAGTLSIKKKVAGTETVLASAPFTLTAGTTYDVTFTAIGGTLQVFVGGVLQLSTTDTSFASGAITVNTFDATGEFDNVIVTSAN